MYRSLTATEIQLFIDRQGTPSFGAAPAFIVKDAGRYVLVQRSSFGRIFYTDMGAEIPEGFSHLIDGQKEPLTRLEGLVFVPDNVAIAGQVLRETASGVGDLVGRTVSRTAQAAGEVLGGAASGISEGVAKGSGIKGALVLAGVLLVVGGVVFIKLR